MSYLITTAVTNYVNAYESGTLPTATNDTESRIYAQINHARQTMNTESFEDYLYELDYDTSELLELA